MRFSIDEKMVTFRYLRAIASVFGLDTQRTIPCDSPAYEETTRLLSGAYKCGCREYLRTLGTQLIFGCRISEVAGQFFINTSGGFTAYLPCPKQHCVRSHFIKGSNFDFWLRPLGFAVPGRVLSESEFNRRFYKYNPEMRVWKKEGIKYKSHLIRHLTITILYDVYGMSLGDIRKAFMFSDEKVASDYILKKLVKGSRP